MNCTIFSEKVICTERLQIRRFRESDFNDVCEYMSDPEVMKYEPPMDIMQSMDWFSEKVNCEKCWAVCLTDTGKLIGDLYMGRNGENDWELGYMFNRKYHKQGYAAEATSALICRTFSKEDAHRICSFCNPENTDSWKLLDRLGFRREGHIRKNTSFHRDMNGEPIWQDTLIYGILREEWMQKNECHQGKCRTCA